MYDAAMIFGQEPDKMRGNFDKFQAFVGDLAEFNLWSYIISETEIMDMAQCKQWGTGNVITWRKTNIQEYNVDMVELKDASELCFEQRKFVIFPKRLPFVQAKETLCNINNTIILHKRENPT